MTETESFDTKALLRDLLNLLRKYNLPIQTAALHLSMYDDDFETVIPQLKTYKMGRFTRHMTIDDVQLLLQARRRLPFAHIVTRLEQEMLPSVQAFADELRHKFPDLHITCEANRSSGGSPFSPHNGYSIILMCRFTDDLHASYNMLQFGVGLRQQYGTDYPLINAHVGWLVDEESGGDWGLDVVRKQFSEAVEVDDSIITMLVTTMYNDLMAFKREIEQHLEWKPYDNGKPDND